MRINVESRIPRSDCGNDKFKPFFGELFETEGLVYVAQVSHPQQKHLHMKSTIDFQKVFDPDGDSLICVVNLNYMFPIHRDGLKSLDYSHIEDHRTFANMSEKSKYINLLKVEMRQINKLGISDKAIELYRRRIDYPNDRVSGRCFDFKALETACREHYF